MNKALIIPGIIGLAAIAIFLFVASTLTSVVVFIPGVIVTFFLYLKTFYKKVPHPKNILPLYLLALGIQFLHFTEEYLTDFTVAVPRLLGQTPYPVDYWLTFNMVAYFIFILGGIALFKGVKEFMIIPLFFILVGVMLNSVGHVLLSMYVGGYFSGLYTALIYLVIGPVLLNRIFKESSRTKINTLTA